MKRFKRLIRAVLFSLGALSLVAASAEALEFCEPIVGRLAAVEGTVEVQRAATPGWQAAVMGDELCEGDSVRAGRLSRAAIALINEAVLRLDQNTTLQLVDITVEEEERSFLELVVGAIQSFSRTPRLLAVNTPYLNATVEGTEFFVEVAADQSSVVVFEGIVAATNPQGELRLASGEGAIAEAGQAPRPRIVVRPRDAVQWALYYPPIFAALGGRDVAPPPDLPPPLAEAAERANQGDVGGALEILDGVPEAERDAQYHTFRAALLLSVGRVDEARAAIDRALAVDPDAGLAYAQRAIIELVQNEEEQALADAERAVELAPEASAPRIALSYAQQGNFQLEAARDTLSQAVEQNPDDPLAWARLAELWMMFGYRDRAREAAERAVALAPDLERTENVLGFANLVEFRTAAAKAAFERAIELDPADPLPRLGLGLAQIRESNLEEGRENLEVAVGLDSSDALLRAYLGKAYFEEKRDDLANEQYQMAQELDPLDPTAYLYEAIKQQTENRPVEALHNLQKSIELNDNRAVYRSRLLLDADRAARGTSLARVYNDLGFEELGFNEATESLTLDPASASAHRFLSDTYRGIRRREIARVSELLQAQMLQDININPVQPSFSETNLNLITQGGPTDAGFNEFTPLFERRQTQIDATGVAGNNDTYGGEGVVSMLYDRYSLSAGAFGFTSDGWRENNDIDHNIENFFFQAAITPELNAQVELRRRHTENGDLEFAFDPDVFAPNADNERTDKIVRAGLRWSPAPHSDFLLSYIHSDRDGQAQDAFTDFIDTPFGPIPVDVTTDAPFDQDANQVETQYIFRQDWYNLVAGFAYNHVDTEESIELAFDGIPVVDEDIPFKSDDYRGYVYANVNLPEPVTWTAGLSYVNYDEDADPSNTVDRFNPKFGVQWDVTDDIRLRAAYTEVVKPSLAANLTLEPTQVAGFNQLFDDANATKSRRYGFGADWQILPDLAIGAEATWRDIEEPFIDASVVPSEIVEDDADEQFHRGYVFWTPTDELALSASFNYDKWKKESNDFSQRLSNQNPLEVKTISVPLNVKYFHPSGFFAAAGYTYVDQDVDRLPQFSNQGDDRFGLVDAAIGYRFPKRLGIASLQVTNLFDKGFKYQDDSFREFSTDPVVGPYFPERIIFGRVTINF